jgi:hypothetical protein
VKKLFEGKLILGFTGTRNGMTPEQKKAVENWVIMLKPSFAIHGDCIGADEDFHQIVKAVWPDVPVTTYYVPGPLRANCSASKQLEFKGHLSRNDKIVKDCTFLLATPPSEHPLSRGGTWYTIRRAVKKFRPGKIITPSGQEQPIDWEG